MATEQPVSSSILPLAVRSEGADRTLQPGGTYTIGRDPQSDIIVTDDRVSWRHATITVADGTWVLTDTGSTNGTFVGRERIGRVSLTGERTIRLGHPENGPVITCSASRRRTRPPPLPWTAPGPAPVRPPG